MAEQYDFPAETIGRLLDLTDRRLQQLAEMGYVVKGKVRGTYQLIGSVQGYIRFLREHGRATGQGSEHSRLARANAVKVEMQNMRQAGQSVNHAHVLELLTIITTQLNSGLEAVAGSACNDLANLTDPGLVRQRLQDEHRAIRRGLADRVLEFAQSCEYRADHLEDDDAADQADAGAVGTGQPDPPTVFPEARAV